MQNHNCFTFSIREFPYLYFVRFDVKYQWNVQFWTQLPKNGKKKGFSTHMQKSHTEVVFQRVSTNENLFCLRILLSRRNPPSLSLSKIILSANYLSSCLFYAKDTG